jgi:hypothetical protein
MFTISININIPQLSEFVGLGRQIVANLSAISTALDELSQTLDTELTQIADALSMSPPQSEVDALAQRVRDLRDRVANIIP